MKKYGSLNSPPLDSPLHTVAIRSQIRRIRLTWQQQIAENVEELLAGRGEQRLLHQIAEVYLGTDEDVGGATPSERFANLVGSRLDLVAVLHEGLAAVR